MPKPSSWPTGWRSRGLPASGASQWRLRAHRQTPAASGRPYRPTGPPPVAHDGCHRYPHRAAQTQVVDMPGAHFHVQGVACGTDEVSRGGEQGGPAARMARVHRNARIEQPLQRHHDPGLSRARQQRGIGSGTRRPRRGAGQQAETRLTRKPAVLQAGVTGRSTVRRSRPRVPTVDPLLPLRTDGPMSAVQRLLPVEPSRRTHGDSDQADARSRGTGTDEGQLNEYSGRTPVQDLRGGM